jgi:hypothetical protein
MIKLRYTRAIPVAMAAAALALTLVLLVHDGAKEPVAIVIANRTSGDEIARALAERASIEVRIARTPRVALGQGEDVSAEAVSQLPVQHRFSLQSLGPIGAVYAKKAESQLAIVIQEHQDKLYSLQAQDDGSLRAQEAQATIAEDLAMARAQLQLLKEGKVVYLDRPVLPRDIPGFHVITYRETVYIDAAGEIQDPPPRDFANDRNRKKFVQFMRDIHERKLRPTTQTIAYPIQLSCFPELVAAMDRSLTVRRTRLVERAYAFNELPRAERKRLYEMRRERARFLKAIQQDRSLSKSEMRKRLVALSRDERYRDTRAAGLQIEPNKEYSARIPRFEERVGCGR